MDDPKNSATVQGLLDGIAPALSAVTGQTWTKAPDDPDLIDNRPGIYQCDETRMAIRVSESNSAVFGRLTARIMWPNDSAHNRRQWHQFYVEGYSKGKEPAPTFGMLRTPSAVAVQIARVLLTPAILIAHAETLQSDAENRASRDAATTLIDALAQASGLWVRRPQDGRGWFANRKAQWEITARPDAPSASVTINLPTDPERAAAMVREIRKMVDGQ